MYEFICAFWTVWILCATTTTIPITEFRFKYQDAIHRSYIPGEVL